MTFTAASSLAGGRSCARGCPRTDRRQHAAVSARSRQQRSSVSSLRSSGPARRRLQLLATSTMSEVAIRGAAEDEYVTLDRTMGSMDLSPTSSMEETGVALPSTVPVQFVVPEYVTKWGQKLKVVGSAQELGNWVPEKAPAMHWHDGHFWTLDVELPVGTVNFKVIMAQENGYVRWEDGDNRAIEIPAVLPDSETPVGHVDVTCNWNDVSHSHTAARPDRAFLRGKLRAVEAKVMAIQERKKRLDTKMLQLNAGLQNFDRVVSALQEDVGDALQDRQRAALARAAGEAAAAGLSSGLVAAQPPTVGPAEAPPAQQNGRPPFLDMPPPVVVPILDPKDLEPIDVAGAQAAAAAAAAASNGSAAAEAAGGVSAEEVQEKLEGLLASQMDHDMLTAAAEAAAVGGSADLGPAAAAEAAQQRSTAAAEQMGLAGADWGPAGGALEQQPQESMLQRISENVLAVTVRRLIAAAEDALDQEPPAVPGEASVDTTQLAVEYLEELEAAAGALEKETDNRLAQLLAAALRATGGVPEDFEALAAPIMAESLRGALRQGRSRAASRAASPLASMGESPLSSLDQPAAVVPPAAATTSYDSLASSWSEGEQEQEAVQGGQQLGSMEQEQAEEGEEEGVAMQPEAVASSSAPGATDSGDITPAPVAAAPEPAAVQASPPPSTSSPAAAAEQPSSPRFTIVASFTPKKEFATGRQDAAGVVTFTANDLQAEVDPAELLARVLQRTLSSHFQPVTVPDVNVAAGAATPSSRSGSTRKQQQRVVVVGGQDGGDWAQKMQVAAAAKEAAAVRVAAAQREADKLRKAAKESLEGFQ